VPATTCGRLDCGLQPGDKFCIRCGKPAPAVAVADAPAVELEPNAVYAGARMLFSREAEEMDPVRNARVLRQLLVQMALFVLGPLIAGTALALAALVFLAINAITGDPVTSALRTLAGVLAGLAYLAAFVLWVIAWFRAVPVRNAEWVAYLDGKGSAAPAVLAQVGNALERRRTPAGARIKRVPLPGGGNRDLLELRSGLFTGYVSVYAFGEDLHVGWVYFWRLSLFKLVLLAVSNLLNGLRSRQTEVHVLARYEPAKTLREALHAATREGASIAAYPAALSESLPTNLPIDAVAGLEAEGNGLLA
jgi:hypothetical protein